MHDTAPASPKRRPGRPAGDGANRDAILDAARELFAARGYDGASMRAIATQAGVDPALIRHFFTDKQGLFSATIADRTVIGDRMSGVFDGDVEGLGERFASAYLDIWEDPDTGPMMGAMLRTALTTERAAELLRDMLMSKVTSHMPTDRDMPDDIVARILLAGAHMLGIVIARNLAQVPPLADYNRDQIVHTVAPAIQHYLAEPLPA